MVSLIFWWNIPVIPVYIMVLLILEFSKCSKPLHTWGLEAFGVLQFLKTITYVRFASFWSSRTVPSHLYLRFESFQNSWAAPRHSICEVWKLLKLSKCSEPFEAVEFLSQLKILMTFPFRTLFENSSNSMLEPAERFEAAFFLQFL